MTKSTITVTFDEEKLGALEFSLKKAGSSVQARLEQTLEQFYEQTVPAPVREYLDSRAAPAPRPRRPAKPASKERPAPKDQPAPSSEPMA